MDSLIKRHMLYRGSGSTLIGVGGCAPLKPISNGFSEFQVGTFLNKSCPRNHHRSTTPIVAEIEYLGEAVILP